MLLFVTIRLAIVYQPYIGLTEPLKVSFISILFCCSCHQAGMIKMQNAGCAAPTLAEAAGANHSPLL